MVHFNSNKTFPMKLCQTMDLNVHTICVLYIISCCFTVSTAENVSITDGATLRQYLCPDTGTLPPNTHLLLSKPQMVLPNEGPRFCLIENTTNLSISPSQDVLSEGHDYVTISCNSVEIGFGFFNVTNLGISSVIFHTCGGYPSSEVVKYVNENYQYLYYDSSVPIVLFFSHCYNIKLHNTSTSADLMNDSPYKHHFIVGVNLCGHSEVRTVIPDGSSNFGVMTMFVYFTDTAILHYNAIPCNLNVTTNGLTSNTPLGTSVFNKLDLNYKEKVDVLGDFVLFLTQSFLEVNVDLCIGPPDSLANLGKYSVVKVVFVNSVTTSRVSFQGYDQPCKLCASENSKLIPMSLHVLFYERPGFSSDAPGIFHPMWIHDTAFGPSCNATLVFRKLRGVKSHRVSLQNVSFYSNSALSFIPLLLAQNMAQREPFNQLYLSLSNITALSVNEADAFSIQTTACLLCFSHTKQISMTGTNYFGHNGGGTVIKLVASELAVSGNLTIMDGNTYQGGGISMDGLSTLAFQEPLVAGFYNNFADQGSAIYSPIGQNNQKWESNIQIRPDTKYSLSNVTSIKVSLHFSDNLNGMINRSFYAPLFSFFGNQTSPNLLFNATTWDSDRSQYAYTTLIDTILHMDRMDKYTSLANGLCVLVHRDWECYYLDLTYKHASPTCQSTILLPRTVYPGQMAFSVNFVINQLYDAIQCSVGFNGTVVFESLGHMKTSINGNDFTKSFWFQQAHLSHQMSSLYVVLITDMDELFTGVPILYFNTSDCPPGYYLKNGSCVCDSKLVSHKYSCDIDAEGFVGPPGYWTGLVGQSLLFDVNCHPNYCDRDKRDFHLTDDPAEACLGNRTGVSCGECKENYSMVFGSDTCYDHCTDVYLLTIPAYALAGLLLVVLLFALRITVATGTINGLIFYTNVLGLVLDQLTEDKVQNSNYATFVRIFISLLNLDIGFPLCFYEGMTTAGKVGFQFLFPVYLWSIVVVLILLSKCSVRLSELISKSSVQVLVTLFYLSFSKLLSTVIVIFSSSTITVIKGPGNYTSRLVWYYDGHDYGSSTHVILLALAVAFTVLFLFPYALLVTFSSFLLRFRIVNKFKPFIDAYGGPFKDKWRFWFGLRLWITILLFCLNGALQGTNTNAMFVVIFLTVIMFMFLQNLARPFKNTFIQVLDPFFMFYCTILVTSFFWSKEIFWWVYIFTTSTVELATVLIVVGHLFALSKTCRAKCVNMHPRERNYYQFHEVVQDVADMELFAAAEDRVKDTY